MSGTGEVTNGDKVYVFTETQSIYLPVGAAHRLNNSGKTDLEMIEIQSGSYLDDDVVRLEDIDGRMATNRQSMRITCRHHDF